MGQNGTPDNDALGLADCSSEFVSLCLTGSLHSSCFDAAANFGGMTSMPFEFPTPPPWIADLPKDDRGFHVPAEAGWESRKPIFSKFSVERTITLVARRSCAVCGYEMPVGSLVYRGFALSDAIHMRQYEREASHDNAGPLHKSCMLYSAIVCPYLRTNGRLGKDSVINPGAERGKRAAVMGFRDLGLLIPAGSGQVLSSPGQQRLPLVAYLELADDIPYREGAELMDRYLAAVEADAEIIEMSKARLFWTDSKQEMGALKTILREESRRIMNGKPGRPVMMQGVGGFVTYAV